VKATAGETFLRETLAVLHMAENDVLFHNVIRPGLPELAPKPYYARSCPGGRFTIALEVLGKSRIAALWVVPQPWARSPHSIGLAFDYHRRPSVSEGESPKVSR
jgi:hypothetical protein